MPENRFDVGDVEMRVSSSNDEWQQVTLIQDRDMIVLDRDQTYELGMKLMKAAISAGYRVTR